MESSKTCMDFLDNLLSFSDKGFSGSKYWTLFWVVKRDLEQDRCGDVHCKHIGTYLS